MSLPPDVLPEDAPPVDDGDVGTVFLAVGMAHWTETSCSRHPRARAR